MNKHYLIILVGTALATLIGLLSASYIIDPFGLYRSSTLESLSRIEQYRHMRKIKPLQVAQRKPQAILLGSSRGGRISVDHPAWNQLNPYNLSIPGITTGEQLQLVRFAHRQQPLREMILALTFNAHLVSNPRVREGFDPGLMNASGWRMQAELVRAYTSTLFSGSALTSALLAGKEADPESPAYLPDGSWHVRSDFFSGIPGFKLVIQNFLDRHYVKGRPVRTQLDDLRELLEFCQSNGIKTHLVIMPTHIFHIEAFERTGFKPAWEQWHKDVLELNERIADAANRPAYQVWGFNTATGVIDEAIRPSSETADSWFGDAVHFKPAFGRLMLDDVLGYTTPPRYGRQLTGSTIDAYLEEAGVIQQNFMEQHAQVGDLLLRNLGLSDVSHNPSTSK